MLLNISWCFLRVVMGKALFIWRQFMDDLHAPRRSSKTVKLFLDCLKPTFSLWLICMYIKSTSVSDTGGEIDCVDKDGNTPLHVAARYGHELLINTLITSGADCTRFDSVFGSLLKILVNLVVSDMLFLSLQKRSTRHVSFASGRSECSCRLLPKASLHRYTTESSYSCTTLI